MAADSNRVTKKMQILRTDTKWLLSFLYNPKSNNPPTSDSQTSDISNWCFKVLIAMFHK